MGHAKQLPKSISIGRSSSDNNTLAGFMSLKNVLFFSKNRQKFAKIPEVTYRKCVDEIKILLFDKG